MDSPSLSIVLCLCSCCANQPSKHRQRPAIQRGIRDKLFISAEYLPPCSSFSLSISPTIAVSGLFPPAHCVVDSLRAAGLIRPSNGLSLSHISTAISSDKVYSSEQPSVLLLPTDTVTIGRSISWTMKTPTTDTVIAIFN